MTADQTRYEFGPLEQRGLIAGVRGGQLAVIGVALLLAVLALRIDSSGRGLAAGLAVVAAAAVAAFVPVGGRTLEEWVPVTARWVARRARRRNRYHSTMPLLGIDADGQATPSPPDTVAGVRILSEPVDGAGPVGILHDRTAGSYAAVLVVRGDSLQLADDDEKAARRGHQPSPPDGATSLPAGGEGPPADAGSRQHLGGRVTSLPRDAEALP